MSCTRCACALPLYAGYSAYASTAASTSTALPARRSRSSRGISSSSRTTTSSSQTSSGLAHDPHGTVKTSLKRRKAASQTRKRSFSLLRKLSGTTPATNATQASFATPGTEQSNDKHPGKRKDASSSEENGIHALTEELAMPSASGPGSMDQMNTLLAFPTLYDPIRKPRNPLVLCHGLYGFDTWGLEMLPALRIHYWADVIAVLKGVVGIDPVITGVPGTGSITERANKLHQSLLRDVKGKDINLVGHSMGGLDGRYLLSHIRPTEYNPLSLTTLATPHRGSQFMEWCRANIGIGDIAKAAVEAAKHPSEAKESAKAKASLLSSDSSSKLLPYSLRTPILSRKQQEEKEEREEAARKEGGGNSMEAANSARDASKEAKKAAIQQAVISIPGLNFQLGTSLASYLLDLLDSPAYGNLTPGFLNDTFNPSTPDRPDVQYFSVAARTPKLSVAHPLWLPKLIMDKAEEMEKLSDKETGRKRPEDWQWGNDGLVPVESAKWGEFLGCMDNVDHFSMRGGSGLKTEFSAKKTAAVASKQAEVVTDKARDMASSILPDSIGEVAASTTETIAAKIPSSIGFGWQVKNAETAGKDKSNSADGGKDKKTTGLSWPFSSSFGGVTGKDGKAKDIHVTSADSDAATSEQHSTIAGLASWITKHIPLVSGSGTKYLKSSIDPSFPFEDAQNTASSSPASSPAASFTPSPQASSVAPSSISSVVAKKQEPTTSSFDTARLLFGSSSSSSSKSSSSKDAKKFNHERFYVALCKKLYDEGL